jgi:hypothetical protein
MTELTLAEIRACREDLEEALCRVMSAELRAFTASTGLAVQGVKAEFVDSTLASDRNRRLSLAQVHVDLGSI